MQTVLGSINVPAFGTAIYEAHDKIHQFVCEASIMEQDEPIGMVPYSGDGRAHKLSNTELDEQSVSKSPTRRVFTRRKVEG